MLQLQWGKNELKWLWSFNAKKKMGIHPDSILCDHVMGTIDALFKLWFLTYYRGLWPILVGSCQGHVADTRLHWQIMPTCLTFACHPYLHLIIYHISSSSLSCFHRCTKSWLVVIFIIFVPSNRVLNSKFTINMVILTRLWARRTPCRQKLKMWARFADKVVCQQHVGGQRHDPTKGLCQ